MKLDRIFSAMAGIALIASMGLSTNVRAEAENRYSYCVSNVCQGDGVVIQFGEYANYRGRVVDTNEYDFTATVRLDFGGYFITDVRNLMVIDRPYPSPNPYPRPHMCPPGYIYDIFRGCVPMVYPRPIPRPVPRPVPVPMPRPVPRPMPRPMPRPVPRPMPRPVPRPMPRPRAMPAPRPVPHPHPAPAPHFPGGHHSGGGHRR